MAKTNFNLSPVYSSQVIKPQIPRKLQNQSWHKFTYKKTYTNVKHKIFEELIPSVLPLLKKHLRLEHDGIVDHSVDLSIPDFLKYKKGMDGSN